MVRHAHEARQPRGDAARRRDLASRRPAPATFGNPRELFARRSFDYSRSEQRVAAARDRNALVVKPHAAIRRGLSVARHRVMAQLILSAAGAAISTYMGFGPAAGWAIGSMLGAATIKNPTQKVQGDQQTIMDLRITGTEYGQAIPFLIGSASIAGQMWWNTDRRPNTVTTTTHSGGGGKGGGGGGTDVTSSTTTYDMDCLIGLTDNPIIE